MLKCNQLTQSTVYSRLVIETGINRYQSHTSSRYFLIQCSSKGQDRQQQSPELIRRELHRRVRLQYVFLADDDVNNHNRVYAHEQTKPSVNV